MTILLKSKGFGMNVVEKSDIVIANDGKKIVVKQIIN
jgi:hypothetical protein